MENLEIVARKICEDRCMNTRACDSHVGKTRSERCYLWTNRTRLARSIIESIAPSKDNVTATMNDEK